MASSNRRTSQKRPGESKRAESVPLTFSPELDRRQEAWDEDDVYVDDDQISSAPTRAPNSSIRYQPPPGSQQPQRSPSASLPSTGQRRGDTRDMRADRDTTGQQTPNGQTARPAASPRRTGQVAAPGAIPVRAGQVAAPGAIPVRAGRGAATAPVPGQAAPLPSPASQSPRRSLHWMVYVGVGMIAALALWVSLSAILAWGTTQYNNIVYGYPRFYQTDAVVGHGDSPAHPSHFIAQNLHGQVIVIELPAGNPAKSYEYVGPDLIASGDDQIPITLSFSDTNHDGKPDMIIHIENREVIFCNSGTKFAQCSS